MCRRSQGTDAENVVCDSVETAVTGGIRIEHSGSCAQTVTVEFVRRLERHIRTIDLITGIVQIVPVAVLYDHIGAVFQLCHQYPGTGERTSPAQYDAVVAVQHDLAVADVARTDHIQQIRRGNGNIITGELVFQNAIDEGVAQVDVCCNDSLQNTGSGDVVVAEIGIVVGNNGVQ